MRRHRTFAILALAATLATSACCRDLSLGLGRVRDFLSGVLDLSLTVDAGVFVSSSFSGSFDAWADIPLFDSGEISTDLSAATWAEALIEVDIDLDGLAEDARLLLPEGVATGGNRLVFVSWRGDAYTVDKGVCYLGWVEGGRVELAASRCGEDLGVMRCSMPTAGGGALSCRLCPASGSCAACDTGGDLDDCLPEKEGGGSIDIDVDIDADIDADIDFDRDADRGAAER
jgi:hypothetical protein